MFTMRKSPRLLLAGLFLHVSMLLSAQLRTVSGTVRDETGNPLPGVTVLNQSSNQSAQTNNNGVFSLQAATGHQLSVSSIGYESQTITVGAGSSLSITLRIAARELQEVTIAYGQKRRPRELGYQAPVVSGAEIAQTQRENFFNSLAGRVPGAAIVSTSGAPGASTSIVLRGGTSIGGINQPLIVVDGVPYDNQTLNQETLIGSGSVAFNNRNSDYSNRAMDINPNDIETVTILKGPEATALYGADGAAGAIIITTKKGKAGAAAISYDNSFRTEEVYRFPEVQQVYGRGTNGVPDPDAVVNPFLLGNLYAFFGPKYPEGTTFYDNFDAFFKTGFTQKHNLSVEGGNDMASFRLSSNFTDQDGVIPTTGFNSLSFRLTGSAKLRKNLSVSSSFTYITSETQKASKGVGGYLLTLLNWPSDDDVLFYQNPDGTRRLLRGTGSSTTEFDNPLWDVNKNPAEDKLSRSTGNIQLNYDPLSWLNISGVAGIDAYSQKGTFAVHPESRAANTVQGTFSSYTQNTRNLSGNIRATVKKDFGKFTNSLTVGFSFDDNRTTVDAIKGDRYYEKNFYSINNTDPLTRNAKLTETNIRKARLLANYNLGYNELVYLSLSGTREGNSTLHSSFVDKDLAYNFGGASLSFVFSDLGVFNRIPWLSYGKARISYASTGKAPFQPYIIDYTMESQITTGGGYAYGVTGNNFNIKPEYTRTLEVGGELRFFGERLGIDVAYYSQRSKDQILAARSSYGTGFVIKWLNGGLVENRGVEIQLTGTPVRTKDLQWNITANFDRNVGQVLEMPADLPTYYDSDTWVWGNIRSQLFKGAFTSNLSGFSYRRNDRGDLLISPTTGLPLRTSDIVEIGDRQPDFKIGLINSIRWKDLSLSFNLDFRKGGDVFNGNEYVLYLTGLSKRSLDRENTFVIKGVLQDGLENSDKPTPNNIAITPYYKSDYYSTTSVPEADFIEEVDWIRLRDVTLSYSLPASVISKQKVFKSASVFVTGTDLFIITNYSGADPSVNANTAFARGYGGSGIDFGSLAMPRGINFGIRVQL